MKRIIAAAVILLIAVGSSLGIYLGISRDIDRLTALACEVRDSVVESGKSDTEQTKRLTAEWEKCESFMAAFLPHGELDDIEIGLKNIENYNNQALTDEYLEELNGCINRLEHIKESEKPIFKNIF